MASQGTLLSLQAGLPAAYPLQLHSLAQNTSHSTWTTGFAKAPVTGKRFLSQLQLEGDGQADTVHHGGRDKAVLVYAAQHYEDWEKELIVALLQSGKSDEFGYGGFGENFTVTDWSETTVCIGDVLSVGEAIVQVSQPRVPCWKISERWGIPNLLARVRETGRTGWYLRVLQEGFVQAGDSLALAERPHPHMTIERVNDVIHKRNFDDAVMRDMAICPELAEVCRSRIQKRMAAAQESHRSSTLE